MIRMLTVVVIVAMGDDKDADCGGDSGGDG